MHRSASPSNDSLLKEMSDSDRDDSDCCIIGTYHLNRIHSIGSGRGPASNCSGSNHQANDENNEIFEENNNDPNNNLEDVQFVQEVASSEAHVRESSMDVPLMNYRTKVTSPEPGCSRDFTEATNVPYYIQREAMQIQNLLPKLKYSVICNNLLQNQHATNRIELTLWDLLPTRRPEVQLGCKRKCENDISIADYKKLCTETNPFQKCQKNVPHTFGNNTYLKNLKEQLKPNVKKDLLSHKSLTATYKAIKQNRILWEPRLIFGATSSSLKTKLTVEKKSILSPPKFMYARSEERSDADINKLKPSTNKDGQGEESCDNVDNMQCSSSPFALPDVIDMKEARNKHDSALQSEGSTYSSDTEDNVEVVEATPDITVFSPIPVCDVEPLVESNNESEGKLKTQNSPDNISTNSSGSFIFDQFTSAFAHADHKYVQTVPKDPSKESGNKIRDKHGFTSKSEDSNSSGDTEDIEIEAAPHIIEITPASICAVEPHVQGNNETDRENTRENTRENSSASKSISSTSNNIFDHLTSLFPHIDRNYIYTVCKNMLKKPGIVETDLTYQYDLLYNSIEHLLSHGKDNLATPKNELCENMVDEENMKVNEQYTNLLGIFPNADPTYLREIAQKVHNNPNELGEFVQFQLETHSYPTREQYIAKRKITEQQKKYTTDFNVEEFLQIFPDPIEYFGDPKRKNVFKPVAFEFLKHWFCKHKVCTLVSVYARCRYHLTETVENLELVPSDMKTKRHTMLLPTEDIPLLQEIAFIKHKSEITQYLNDVKDREVNKFRDLKEQGKLWTCECCFDEECMPSKCSSCQSGHIFCNSCIRSGTETKIADGETCVPCFVLCGAEFSLAVLQRVLPPTQFSILLRKRQEAEVMAAGLEGLVFCPFCHFASIPPPEDKVFKCFNPECMKESCRLCKKLNHLPLKCDEAVSENARHYLEEKMTEALVRTCYQCKRPFFKEEGCNKMTCICGAVMCYICDKPIDNYKHFNEGATTSNLCPLWSDNKMINTQAVVRVAKAVDKEIRQQNPNINLNTKALLPQLPPAKSNNR